MKLRAVQAPAFHVVGARIVDVDTMQSVEDVKSISYRHDANSLPVLVIEILITDGEAFVEDPGSVSLGGEPATTADLPRVVPGMVIERHGDDD